MLEKPISASSKRSMLMLNDLPSWSPWPARICGIEPWSVPRRNLEKVKAEYDDDKYRKLLDWVEKQEGPIRFVDAHRAVLDIAKVSPDSEVCISRRQELFLIKMEEAFTKQFEELRAQLAVAIDGCNSVVELGCGAGFNLWYLTEAFKNVRFGGGDFSRNAVSAARRFGQSVVEFNFYDASNYSFLEGMPEPIAVFTSHALEQLPSASSFFQNLSRYRDKIKTVINLEPFAELHDKTLLGLLRSRYTQMNDYNRDLLTVLRSPAIQIDRMDYDVIGLNPLNPTSVVQWHFV